MYKVLSHELAKQQVQVSVHGDACEKYSKSSYVENRCHSNHDATRVHIYWKSGCEWWRWIGRAFVENGHLLFSRTCLERDRLWQNSQGKMNDK